MKKVSIIFVFCFVAGGLYYQARQHKAISNTNPKPTNYRFNAKEFVTADKIRVLYKNDNNTPLIAFNIRFKGMGNCYNNKVGLGRIFVRMLAKGTAKRSEEEIKDYLKKYGIKLNFRSQMSDIVCTLEVLKDDLPKAIEILKEILLSAAFPKQELKIVKDDIIADLKAQGKSPQDLVNKVFSQVQFEDHVYFNKSYPTKDNINDIKSQDLHKYLTKFNKSSIEIGVCGNITKAQINDFIGGVFGQLPAQTKHKSEAIPQHITTINDDIKVVPFKTKGNQAYSLFMLSTFNQSLVTSQRSYAKLILLNSLLNEYLFNRIRSNLGLAYYVATYIDYFPHSSGLIYGVALLKVHEIPQFTKALRKLIGEFRKDGISMKELKNLKHSTINSLYLKLKNSPQIASRLSRIMQLQHNVSFIDEIPRDIKSIKYQEFQKFLNEILDEERICIIHHDPTKG